MVQIAREKYNELEGCGEQCTIADLYRLNLLLITLFDYSQS